MPYLATLALTLVIEVPLYALVLGPGARRLGGRAALIGATVLTGTIANLVSHPIAFLAVEPLLDGPVGATAALVVVEVLVLMIEAGIVVVRHRDPVLATTSAGVANLVSLSIGLAIV